VHPPLGLALQRGGVDVVALAPRYQAAVDAPLELAADPVRSVNDNSLVIALRFAGRTLLFTGDIEAEGEDQLVAAGLSRVDVLKVAHHGSPTSSSESFIAATRPALAVISCGRGNSFGFPSAAVLARLAAVGAEIARVDLEGSVGVTVDRDGAITVERFVTPLP
jgi:competence protein ComEC